MIDYEKFRKLLKNLELQYENYRLSRDRPGLNDLDKEGLAESVIQRFEITYDIAWKTVKRYLTDVINLPEVPNSPKPIFRLADENSLLSSEDTNDAAERWLKYAAARCGTTHDYAAGKADDCLVLVPGFIKDAVYLYQTMSGEQWTQTGTLLE